MATRKFWHVCATFLYVGPGMNCKKKYSWPTNNRAFLAALAFSIFGVAFGQSDRGSITGTVTDPQGASASGASVQAINADSGQRYPTKTTETGNYTLSQLPAGQYNLEVELSGFKKFVRQGITVQVSQTGRIDVTLQVGAVSDSVTVEADTSLLKTETTEVSHNISTDTINALPITNSGFRSPYNFLNIMPGASLNSPPPNAGSAIRVNGLPANSGQIRIDGLESGNAMANYNQQMVQPSVDSLQEVSLQTSNFAAEYGQAAGGLVNFTSRSGSNLFHGRVYEYLTNDKLNAGRAFTDDGNGHLVRPPVHGSDYGFTIGGPIWIPKVYDGHNRTFFFVSYEAAPRKNGNSVPRQTTPTVAMRGGDFSGILGPQIGNNVDPLKRPLRQNQIFDPTAEQVVNGQVVRTPFPGNIIPAVRLSPVALKIQSYLPLPMREGNVSNFDGNWVSPSKKSIPTIKVDQTLTNTAKLSFFYSYAKQTTDNASGAAAGDGFPAPATQGRDNRQESHTSRLAYDQALAPTLLLHLGVGFETLHFGDELFRSYTDASGKERQLLDFDSAAELGLKGAIVPGFPRITGLSNAFGGAPNLGSSSHTNYYMQKPSAVASITYVRRNHTYKAGAEWRIDAVTNRGHSGQGTYGFSGAETAQPYLQSTNLAGSTLGFPYASFLLGLADSASIRSNIDAQVRKSAWGVFIQDTWKIRRNLTVDYGLRWDLQSAFREINDRLTSFDPKIPNPSAGGRPGAVAFAGNGPGTCNCNFANTYPYAIGPRLGVAYQFLPKTVLRGGWGISYGPTPTYNFFDTNGYIGVGFNTIPFTSPAFGQPALNLNSGLQYNPADLYAVNHDPGIRPSPGQTNSPGYWIDPNGGRPSRISQWSIGIQRELTSNLVIEGTYVGNRGVWEWANSNAVDLNGNTAARLASFGLNIDNASDRNLLLSPMTSSAVALRGFTVPYAGFPATATLAQALRPFPQYTTIPVIWAPVGKSWYDALQTKLTQRFAHGLSSQVSFSWSKNLSYGENAAVNDAYNVGVNKTIAAASQPFVTTVAVTYEVPKFGKNRWMNAVARGWTLGTVLRYSSGLPLQVPNSNNNLNNLLLRQASPATFANRVPGQPLFTVDINCHCYDPNKTLVLNPAAWSDPPAGQFGTSAAYYNDYRLARRPAESFSVGRNFKIVERITFEVRAQFSNMFNRAEPADPTATNFAQPPAFTSNGQYGGGFGWINTGSLQSGPRTGQIYGRLIF